MMAVIQNQNFTHAGIIARLIPADG
jgi:hypothetical protein